jgi:Spy/CpxP family protein refolding chaperone
MMGSAMTYAMRSWPVRMVICAGLIGLSAAVTSADPTTLPSATRPAGAAARRPGPSYVVQRLRRMVSQLSLTDDQKTKVSEIFDQATRQAQDLSQSLGDLSPVERGQKLSAFAGQIRQQLAQVLSDDQMKTLQQKVGPASRPAGGDFPSGEMVGNIQQAVAKLDLSPNQQQQVKDLIDSALKKAADLRAQAINGADVQTQMQQLRQDVRSKLQSILTPDQMQSLGQSMQQYRQQRAGGNPASAAKPLAVAEEPNPPADVQTPVAENPPAPTVDVGSGVPDVKIIELNGRAFVPANYKGHVLVLEFGSMSCPVFRDHARDMEKLKTSEGPRAFFLCVYTREAFPAGDKNVQRNKDQNISIPQASTLDARKMQARQTQQALGITIPMAVDSMDNGVSNAFGTFPNGAVVIGKDGQIAALEHWSNPDSLRRAIDQAYQAPSHADH